MPTTLRPCSTIANQYDSCDPAYGQARPLVVDDAADVVVYLRAHEVYLSHRPIDPKHACYRCAKQVVAVRTAWDHRITSDSSRGGPGSWTLGEDWFETLRHADGTTCGEDHFGEPIYSCFAKPVCMACGEVDTMSTVQQAYGDLVTCISCGDEHYYSIGD